MSFDFDEIIDRVGTHSSKWDTMESKYGVSPKTGIPMWVADMDFRAPPAVQSALAMCHAAMIMTMQPPCWHQNM